MSVATQAISSASFQPNPNAAAPSVNGAGHNGSGESGSASNPASSASEVGWLFVPQYYTFMNEKPERLHCFYTKNSTFMHGSEDESELKAYYGQQEIHKKILSLGLVDCQVFVAALDSQASANGGIIIQVLGDMSNDKGPWRKFAQTFFLAEQPNGYYVLNDIFRYLKDEDDEHHHEAGDAIDDSEGIEAAILPESESLAAIPQTDATATAISAQPVDAAPAPSSVPPLSEAPGVVNDSAAKVAPAASANGQEADISAQTEEVPAPTIPNENAKVAAEEPEPQSAPKAATAEPTASKSSKPAAAAAAAVSPPAPTPAPVTKPGTWASLAATGKDKWGTAVSSESRGVTANRAAPPARAAPPQQSQQQQQQQQQTGQASSASGSGPSAAMKAAMSQNHGHCFVKSVLPEKVTKEALEQALTSRFGPLKECSVVPAKACAFVEFASVDGARRAIAMSLKPEDGGEGGVPIGNGWSVTVGEKKDKKDRPPPSQRQPGGGPSRTNSSGGGGGGGGGGSGGARGDYARGAQRGNAGGGRAGRDGAHAAA